MTAEAGIGKSRFAAEVERLAAGYDVGAGRFAAHTGARVLSVRCAAFGERRRLAPLADLVRAAVGLPSDGTAAVTRPVVEERLRRLGQRLARFRPDQPPIATDLLLALLGYAELSPAARRAGRRRRRGRRAARARTPSAVPAAVADLLSALAAETPLVVIVDDLHDATAGHRRRPRRDAVPADRTGAGAAARPPRTGPHRRCADPGRRRRGVHPAAAARCRRGPAAHHLPRRRPAAAGRHRPAARHRPGQPVLPRRTGHPADRARRAHRRSDRRRAQTGRAHPAAGTAVAGTGTVAAGARLAGQPAALPRPGRGARRPDRRAARRRPLGAARRRRRRRHACRPARSRRCASGGPGATAGPPRWPRSSWSAPSTSCCNAGCCTAPGTATPSPPR